MIIFDCDGVLVDSEIISNSVDAEAFNALGHPITPAEMIRRFIGRPKKEIWAEIERDIGRPLPADFAAQLQAATISRYRRELKAIPGIGDVLQQLKGKKCVASSSEMTKLRLALELTGLLASFEPWIFSASQVARGKPAPDLFLYAAGTVGVAPQDCVVIEDSTAGVRAGLAAGMSVIGFTGGSHTYDGHGSELIDAGAAIVIADMKDVLAALRAIGKQAE